MSHRNQFSWTAEVRLARRCRLTEPLTTAGFKAGKYSIVGYGVWTKFTAVSDFEVTTNSTSKAKPKAAPKSNTVRKAR